MQTRQKSLVRVAAVQYEQKQIADWAEFESKVRHLVEIKRAILTPCDFPFARDGVAAELDHASGGIIFAGLDLSVLAKARSSGTVQNVKDRRSDLYSVQFVKR